MKHHYVLSKPWLSSGSDGLVEDYATNLTDNVIIEKYTRLERIFGLLGLNQKVSEEKNEIYHKIIDAFYNTISLSEDIDISFYESVADSIDIEAKNIKRAYAKLCKFNDKLDNNLSSILHKENYHLNLYGDFVN
jgi:hypothetical protein